MIHRFETERPSSPALSLNTDSVVMTAIMGISGTMKSMPKQVRALGQAGDVLPISTHGNGKYY